MRDVNLINIHDLKQVPFRARCIQRMRNASFCDERNYARSSKTPLYVPR